VKTRPLQFLTLSALIPLLSVPLNAQAQEEHEPDREAEATLWSFNVPKILVAGEPFGAHFEYENRSDIEWTAEGGVSLVPLGDNAGDWDLTAIELRPGEVVEPGVKRTFAFTARAPQAPGTYLWRWELQQDGRAIEQIAPPEEVEVVAPDPDADYEPRFFREHRGDLEVHENRPLALRTEDGQPIFLMGKSAFGLLARRGSGPFMEEAAEQGFNMVRVYLLAPDLVVDPNLAGEFELNESGGPWEFDIQPAGDAQLFDFDRERNRYWSRLDTLLDKAVEKGMVVELVIFTAGSLTFFEDPTVFDDRKKAFVTSVVERIGDRLNEDGANIRGRQGHVWLEVIDEHQRAANGPGSYPHEGVSVDFVNEVADFVLSEEARINQTELEAVRRIVTASAAPSDEPAFGESLWSKLTILHLPNVDGWETRIRDVMLALRETGRPIIDDRSVGSGERLPEEERDDDAVKHRTRLWAAAFAGGYTTFHSDRGIPAGLGTTPGMEAVAPLKRFMETLDHWVLEPVLEGGILKAHDADEVWLMASRNQYAAYFRTGDDGSGQVTIDLPQRGVRPLRYEVRWFDPTTGKYLNRDWLNAGEHTLDLPGLAPDVVLMAATLDSLKTPALIKLEPNCFDTEFNFGVLIEGAGIQPGVHLIIDEVTPVQMFFQDDENAVFNARRWLGEEVEKNVYEFIEGTWSLKLRNYTGRSSASATLRIVKDSIDCETPAEGEAEGAEGEGEETPEGPAEGEDEGEAPDGEGEGEGEAPGGEEATPEPDGESDEEGCGCTVAGSGDAGLGWLGAWALGLVVLRWRR
jgi:hypothetical protein